MYASEPHFGGITDKLKLQMRKSIRENRCLAIAVSCNMHEFELVLRQSTGHVRRCFADSRMSATNASAMQM